MAQETEFSPDEVRERAAQNLTGTVLGTIVFLRERGIPAEEWSRFLGRRFTDGWERLRGQGARAAIDQMALNFVSTGARIESLTGDEAQSEVVASGWPPREFLDLMGVSQEEAHAFMHAARPIADYLGLRADWQVEGDRVTLRFSR